MVEGEGGGLESIPTASRKHGLIYLQLWDDFYLAVVEGEEYGVGDVHRVAGVAVFRHKGVHGSRTGWLTAAITTCQEIH
jgi:hypothetical protein